VVSSINKTKNKPKPTYNPNWKRLVYREGKCKKKLKYFKIKVEISSLIYSTFVGLFLYEPISGVHIHIATVIIRCNI